jgi:U3 small nucleolar RNA-associated protein 22
LYGIAGEDAAKEVTLSLDVRKATASAFEERRVRDPGMSSGAWHIATERDIAGVWWCTDGRGPTAMVADRVAALAKASVQAIQQGLDVALNVKVSALLSYSPGTLLTGYFQALFHHPLDGYDFVVHLEPSVLPRYAQSVLPDETVWTGALKHVNVQATSNPSVLVGFDPAKELLDDLQVRF